MTASLHAFLSGLIDYAGLFPPAALDLDPALRTYQRDRAGGDAWMLNRFILPVSRLDELQTYQSEFDASSPLRLSLLGYGPSEAAESWSDRAERTLVAAQKAESGSGGGFVCDRFELRMPVEVASDADGLAETLVALESSLRSSSRDDSAAALEVPFLDAPDSVGPAVQAIAEANARVGRSAFALKLRCGGVTADLFPSVEGLASAIAEALRAGIPFKATAGLHHPVRQYREEVGTEMHGFVNVFGGAILARAHGLDADALAEILDDTHSDHFELADVLRWNRLEVSDSTIAEARQTTALSYGSCSFDEPREDLRQLGWL